MEYAPSRRVSLRGNAAYNEKWLQQLISDDPAVLGLGELVVRDVERPQPRAGRLDLLLSDPATRTRYEVEIQLGPTDESHIIRTIEYWDIERARYPQYDHVAVLVPEDITSRFLNVISLFNRAIPLVAIQLNALEVDGKLTVNAATVLDLVRLGTDEEDEPGQLVDRSFWESRSSPTAMAVVDKLHRLIQQVTSDATLMLKYNKAYIGLSRAGIADNFIYFNPRKNGRVLTAFKLERSEDLMSRVEEAGLDVATGYDPARGRFVVRLTESDLTGSRDLIEELISRAADIPVGPTENDGFISTS